MNKSNVKSQFLLKFDDNKLKDKFSRLCSQSHITMTRALILLIEFSLENKSIFNPLSTIQFSKNQSSKTDSIDSSNFNFSMLDDFTSKLDNIHSDLMMVKKAILRDPGDVASIEYKLRKSIVRFDSFTIKELEIKLAEEYPELEEDIRILKLYQNVLIDLENEEIFKYYPKTKQYQKD